MHHTALGYLNVNWASKVLFYLPQSVNITYQEEINEPLEKKNSDGFVLLCNLIINPLFLNGFSCKSEFF